MEKENASKSSLEGTEVKDEYPRGALFIAAYKVVEKFSFYAIFVLLTLYIHHELDYDESNTEYLFHFFMMLLYFCVLIGGVLADDYLGKFWTMFHLTILFIIGNLFMFLGSILTNLVAMRTLSLFGLLFIAIASGGIKPVASAFGGDQFQAHQVKQRQSFFSYFFTVIYFSHIVGAVLAPILRSDVHCFGRHTCYPLAFGTTAITLCLSNVILFVGKPFYRIAPVQGGMFVRVFQCIKCAVATKYRSKIREKEHWLDYAEDEWDESIISEIKILFHVLQVYIPLPVYFTLGHQLGSTWVLQAAKMDGEFCRWRIKPDQMIMLFPAILVVVIPTLEAVIYPMLKRLGVIRTYLQKIWTGGMLMAISFTMAGFVQLRIDRNFPAKPKVGLMELTVVNNSPCTLSITGADNISLKAFEFVVVGNISKFQERVWKVTPSGCSANEAVENTFSPQSQYGMLMVTLENDRLQVLFEKDDKFKLKDGNPRVRLFFSIDDESSSFEFRGIESLKIPANNSKTGMTEYWEIDPGEYQIYLTSNRLETFVGPTKFKTGGNYAIVFYQNSKDTKTNFQVIETLKGNSVPILLQVPQYIFLGCAEAIFIVQGTAFAYAEAPPSMKSVVVSFWYAVFGFGNALLLVMKLFTKFFDDTLRFFFYAFILFLDMMVFMVIAHYYTYINEDEKKKPDTKIKTDA